VTHRFVWTVQVKKARKNNDSPNERVSLQCRCEAQQIEAFGYRMWVQVLRFVRNCGGVLLARQTTGTWVLVRIR
jgi:hypothetical protein